MAKKDLLKQAAGAHVRKTLGGEVRNEQTSSEFNDTFSETLNEDSTRSEIPDSFEKEITKGKSDINTPTEKNETPPKTLEEKHLPKKNHLHRISSVMRLEDYTKPESPEREGSSRFLKIAGVILLVLAIWFFWPAKHEIYMDIDKMTPEKVSGMSSQKEYHFLMDRISSSITKKVGPLRNEFALPSIAPTVERRNFRFKKKSFVRVSKSSKLTTTILSLTNKVPTRWKLGTKTENYS